MSEQNKKPAISIKCEGCANRIKLTHFGEGGKDTYSYACVLLPLLPIIAVEGVGTIVNVKDCEAFEHTSIEHGINKTELLNFSTLKGDVLKINRNAAELYLMQVLKDKFPTALEVEILNN